MAANMTQVKTLCVVKVAGDGNCLFHALALHEGIGGAELKTEVIDHMDIMAEEDSALREAWHGEADYLRGPEQSHWGGHMAIIAYSAMRQRRVMVHEKPYDGDVKDHRCAAQPEHVANKTIACEHCELPVCRQCHEDLTQAKLPRLSYANEMFTGYGLKRIYKDKVTAMELVCASPALTSMILMSMESRRRNQSKTSAFDEQAHMARHRYGARGNVITFPLPTEEILRALDDFMESNGPADTLPRSGKQLADVANKGAAGLLGVAVGDPLVRKRCPITAALLRDWLRSPRAQENTNAEQHRFLGLVVDRLLVERNLISAEDANKYCREPMLHLLHGPPGTGKSHCLLFLREIFNLLEYKQGIDYEVVAFQAVNASALAGKTIHHACGFNTDQYNASEAGAVAATTAKRISYWRWLFIDEVSMVGARLLARTDHRLRSVKPDADAFKFDQGGQVRQGLAI
eukprot:g27080.t1